MPVWIHHPGQAAFVADPTIAALYNRGQVFRRRAVSAPGECCDWFALAPTVLLEIRRALHGAHESRRRPFAAARVSIDGWTYLLQRQLVERLLRSECDPLAVEERVVRLAARILEIEATTLHAAERSRHDRIERLHRDQAEHAREVLGSSFAATATLTDIASRVGVSVFHLCRIFRRQTGA